MKKVEIIRPITLADYDTTKGPINPPIITGFMSRLAKFGLLVGPSLILFMGVLFLSVGISPDDGSGPMLWLCLICSAVIVSCLLWLRWIIKGGVYKPGKSFRMWRLTKKKISVMYTAIAIIVVAVCVAMLTVEFKISIIFYLLAALFLLYFLRKSFKVHEDVDYVANQELADILGMDIDEKVQASYLKDDIIFLLTDKKIIFAYLKGKRWKVINKKIDEISKIGVYSPMMKGSFFNTDLFFSLTFDDSTTVGLEMELIDNITSNPDLFFKKFIATMDKVLLGKIDERVASRRRVSVNNEPKPAPSVNEEGSSVRKTDISETILENLHNATPIKTSRTLEL